MIHSDFEHVDRPARSLDLLGWLSEDRLEEFCQSALAAMVGH